MASAAGAKRRLAVVIGVLGVVSGCGGSQASEHSADATLKFLPATLEAARPRPGDPRTARVRVYADPGVRALPRWREDLTDEIDYASQLLTPLVGVRLQVDGIKDWPRAGDPDPRQAIKDLITTDGGDNATWVIGFVTPADTASTAMSELGAAEPLGHHVIVRAWAEKPETDALAGRLPDLKSGDRAEVLAAHHRHKQAVVLLHMLAATLGAIDEADPAWIQHARYAPKQNTFANRTRDLLQLAIDSRLSGDTDTVTATKVADSIESADWGGWIPASHDEVLRALRHVTDTAHKSQTFASTPAAASEELARIATLAKQGQLDAAKAELANLLAAYPGNAQMHELSCELMIAKPGVTDKATRAACAHVSDLAPGDPTVHLAVGEALILAHDLAGARGELLAAEAKIANLPTGAADAWHKLIGFYLGLGALTWTEDAIGKAGLASDPAARATASTRARYGIPRGARFVAPEQEAQLVAAIRDALDKVYASKFADAERVLAAAEKKWRGAPGLIAARCDLAFRMGQIDAARATCSRALAADPDDSWAPNYDTRRGLENYLFTIAAHKLADHYRRSGRRPAVTLDAGDDSSSGPQVASADRRASALVRSAERQQLEETALHSALSAILTDWSQKGQWQKMACVELLLVRGATNKEAAQSLGISEQAVANQKFEFLERLRGAIGRQRLSPDVFPELAEK